MQSQAPVDRWIRQWQQGRQSAARRIWDRCYSDLIEIARRRLRGRGAPVVDEEDVVSLTLHSFFRRARRGDFPRLHGDEELRRLLCRMVACKVVAHLRYLGRRKRAPSARAARGTPWEAAVEQLVDSGAPPEGSVALRDQFQHLFQLLPEPELRELALLKMQGFTQAEIAIRQGRSLATIERRLRLIRDIWQEELQR